VPSRKQRAERLFQLCAPAVVGLIFAFCLVYVGPDWYEGFVRWVHPDTKSTSPNRWASAERSVKTPITITPPRPLGTDSSVSPTPLALVLVSTQLGRNSREGFAQIGVNALSPQTYQVGAILVNGARLTEIHDQYVVLERNGKTGRLNLNEPSGSLQARSPLLTVGGNPKAEEVPATADPLAKYVRTSPLFVGNRLQGLAMYPGADAERFSKMGLQPGDLLTEIDGSRITTSLQAVASLHTLLSGSTLTVQINRQGVAQTLSLDGSILLPPAPKRSKPLPYFEGLASPLERSL